MEHNLLLIARDNLATAIAKAYAADDAFKAALTAASYRSRWDWSVCEDSKPRAAYIAKVQADEKMHEAFEMIRQLAR